MSLNNLKVKEALATWTSPELKDLQEMVKAVYELNNFSMSDIEESTIDELLKALNWDLEVK
tara:strand:+ start:388 stop:570 length:183 start_codon:yes stop_codon:yes gene_type:complete